MAYTQADLREAFRNTNVKAFYMVVRRGESALDYSAYSMVNGAPPITTFSKHPYAGMSTTVGGRAAGAAQFIPSTWGELAEKYGFESFTPDEQDMGYVGCLIKRNALADVIAGNFTEAIRKCRLEWTSLPGAAENHGAWNLAAARRLYEQYGGTFGETTQPAAPIEERSTTMDPLSLIALFGPLISNLIPQVAKLFDKKTETPEKIVAAQKVIETVVASTDSINVQEAVQKMQADPEVLKTATVAVVSQPDIMAILEVGGGVVKAREFDLAQQAQAQPFWKTSAVFWISILLLPMVIWYVGSSIVGGVDIPADWPWYAQFPLKLFGTAWSLDARSGLANLVVGLILGGICGVYFGVSVTQAKQQQQSNNEKGS